MRPSCRSGFTLLELVVVIALAMLLLGIAVPALDGVMATGRLETTLEAFTAFVEKTRDLAIKDNRTLVMVWDKKYIRVFPDGFVNDPDAEAINTFLPGDGELYSLVLPASLEKNPGPEWTIWPTGGCEPAKVRYDGPSGTWEATYSPLASRVRLVAFSPGKK